MVVAANAAFGLEKEQISLTLFITNVCVQYFNMQAHSCGI